MIIDAHLHLSNKGWIHDSFFIGAGRIFSAMIAKETGERPDPIPLGRSLIPQHSDLRGEGAIKTMDAAGVDKSCVFALDWGLITGEPDVSIEEQNRVIADLPKHFPGRFIPFFAIDPRRPQAVEMFSRAVEDWGMKGLKIHPATGFYPYDEICYPLYEKCLEYRMPVIIHTGAINAPLKSRFTRPMNVDDMAADFPDLPIIMAHTGFTMWREALDIAGMKPNIYFDFSAWQLTFTQFPQEFYIMLRRVIDEVGPWRVFFGSDGALHSAIYPLKSWVQAIRAPDLTSCPEISFTEAEKEIVLGKAFARLLNIGR
ncbi:MAG: amidohydrolase [Deltaproteobacteria bacterium]|nr:amidohydrolase [Deltaproteobacteria bacterium]